MARTKKAQPLPDTIGPLFSDENTDPAKFARRLLDTIAICDNISTALSEFIEKYADRLPKCAVAKLQLLADASKCIHVVGMQQTTNVSIVKGLLPAYKEVRQMKEEEERERDDT